MNVACVIGFSQSSWTFDEPQNLVIMEVYLQKDNQTTEQTFDVQITLAPISRITTATRNEDYAPFFADDSVVNRIFPNQDRIAIRFRLFPDIFAEGDEGFVLISSPNGDPRYTLPSPTSSVFRMEEIVIRDDDRKLS